MSKSKILAVVLVVVLALGVVGCGKKNTGSSVDVKEHFSKEQSMDFETTNRERVRVCLDDKSGYSLSRTSTTFIIRDADGKELVSGLFGNVSLLNGYKVTIANDPENLVILEDSVKDIQVTEEDADTNKDSKTSEDSKSKDKKSEDKSKEESNKDADKNKPKGNYKGTSIVAEGDYDPQVLVWTEKVGTSVIINRAEAISTKSIVAVYSSLDKEEFDKVLENVYIMIVN